MTDSFQVHTELVSADDSTPERWMLVLHGVFGSGSNWRSFSRRLAAACPRWGYVLVDLRGHGQSQGAQPPHDLASAAADLLAVDAPGPIDGIIAHSMGGKIALAYARSLAEQLDQVWILDTRPGTKTESTLPERVLELLEALPERFDTRNAFVQQLVDRGQSKATASWLAMSLRRDGSGYRLGLDLALISSVLQDYFQRDLWSEIERVDSRRELHFVIAGKSVVLSASDRERLASLEGDGTYVHTLEESGHWLNVDAPDDLQELIVSRLEAIESK